MIQEKILVIQLRQLGDILLTTPLIRHLKLTYPETHIGVLTHSMGKKVLRSNPYINEHLCYNTMSWTSLVYELQKYTIVLDGMNNPRSSLHAFLCRRAHTKLFFRKKSRLRSLAYSHTVEPSPLDYIVYEKLMFLKFLDPNLDVKTADVGLDLFLDQEDRSFAHNFFPKNPSARATKNIVFAATHRRALRRWPYFSALAQALLSQGHRVFWLWGPGEKEEVENAYQNQGVILPQTTFSQMAALLEAADLVIANSNGPSHVAVAMKTPSIQIHGPTRLESWCPPSILHQGIQNSQLDQITVEQVLSLVEQVPPSDKSRPQDHTGILL